VVRASGELLTLNATGMPVGLMDAAEFGVSEEWLAPGDKIVIYTDGVTEAQNAAGEFFGKKRLREIVAARAGERCQAVHDAIRQGVTEFTEGAPQSDDITLVVLEFGGTG
jgi:sigma-B regulation protein RsbU (phosphoserine phosphatase)